MKTETFNFAFWKFNLINNVAYYIKFVDIGKGNPKLKRFPHFKFTQYTLHNSTVRWRIFQFNISTARCQIFFFIGKKVLLRPSQFSTLRSRPEGDSLPFQIQKRRHRPAATQSQSRVSRRWWLALWAATFSLSFFLSRVYHFSSIIIKTIWNSFRCVRFSSLTTTIKQTFTQPLSLSVPFRV